MSSTFLPGQTVWLETAAERCEIKELIGAGRLGQVYRVTLKETDFALKWYFPELATPEQRACLESLVRRKAPSDRFLWPFDTVLCQGFPSFGYIMPFRNPRFRGMADLMRRTIDPTFRVLTTAAVELADSFLRLHTVGLCYSDISFGNIFFDPNTGEISIGDNDHVAMEGEGMSGVSGRPAFMAPEVVRGEAKPSIATDLHSLAVLLFHLLVAHHPLEGRLEGEMVYLDRPAMQKLYGERPLFIFDPKNLDNRPVPGMHDNALVYWNFYPGYLRDLLTRTFTQGLRDPGARVRETEWRTVFTRMRDQVFYCHKCGAENFLPDEGDLPGRLPPQECWSCHEFMAQPLRLRLGHHAVVLNQDSVLYAHHLDANRRNDYSQIMAEMTPHPSRSDLWGLKNVSAQLWICFPPVGGSMEVPSGRAVSLVSGLRIRFGNVEGMVL